MSFSRALSVVNTLVLRGFGSGMSVLFTVLVARYLDTAAAARFFMLFNASVIAALCFRWGLDEVIVRRVASAQAKDLEGLSRYLLGLSHRRVLSWTLAAFALTGAVAVAGFDSPLAGIGFVEVACMLLASSLVALVAAAARISQGRGRTNAATFLLNIIVPLLSLLGLGVLVSSGHALDAAALAIIYLIAAAISYALSVVQRYGSPFSLIHGERTGIQSAEGQADRRASVKLGGVVVAQQALGWAAVIIVPLAYGEATYTGFVVVQKLATLISLAMLAVNFTFSSRFASLHASGNRNELLALVKVSVAGIIGASIVVALAVFGLREQIFAFSKIGENMQGPLVIMLIGQLMFSLASLYAVVLSMCQQEGFLLKAQVMAGLLGIPLFYLLSKVTTLEVACGAFVVSYGTLATVLGVKVYRI